MPEFPDLENYVDAIERLLVGRRVTSTKVQGVSLLKTVEPKLDRIVGMQLLSAARLGKRIQLRFEEEVSAVLHLMIAGRLRWREPGKTPSRRIVQLVLGFEHGSLYLTEVSKKKRARLHLVEGAQALAALQPTGVSPYAPREDFVAALRVNNHTVKRALTDQRIVAGIGNAYSDEILFDAQISPIKWTTRLDDAEMGRLHASTASVLSKWRTKLIAEVAGGFPEKVTAFHSEMSVHGRFEQPCRRCQTPIQRLRKADNECNYCPRCQTEGKVLRDRSLSRLLRDDWPITVEALEEHMSARRQG